MWCEAKEEAKETCCCCCWRGDAWRTSDGRDPAVPSAKTGVRSREGKPVASRGGVGVMSRTCICMCTCETRDDVEPAGAARATRPCMVPASAYAWNDQHAGVTVS